MKAKKFFPKIQPTVNALEKSITLSVLIKEWSLWSIFLGKVLLVNGPISSGKTSLVFKIVEKLPFFKTINRKLLAHKVDEELNKIFFKDFFERVHLITGKKVTNLIQLYQIKSEDLSLPIRNQLQELKYQVKAISEGVEFNDFALKKLFYLYYDEIKKYIFSGENVIIDGSEVESDRSYSLFIWCFNYYPHIKRVILFDTIQGTLEKSNIRNIKYLRLLEQSQSIEGSIQKLKEIELETGGSQNTCRLPKIVFESYKKYYAFSSTIKDKFVLEKTTNKKIISIILEVEREQLDLLKKLISYGYVMDISKDLINLQEEFKKIPKKETIYITSRSHFDYLIKTSSFTELSLLDNPDFLKHLLQDILPWLSFVDYNDTIFNCKNILILNQRTCTLNFKEWALWSKCFGKVVMINGLSCSGKTTLTKNLSKYGFNRISTDDINDQNILDQLNKLIPSNMSYAQKALIKEDDIKKIFLGHKINKNKYDTIQIKIIEDLTDALLSVKPCIHYLSLIEEQEKVYNEAKKYIFSGQNVIIDTVLETRSGIDSLSYSFNYYPIVKALLYSSLEETIRKCFSRNYSSFEDDLFDYRHPLKIVGQYFSFFKTTLHDNSFENYIVLEKVNKIKTKEILTLIPHNVYTFSQHVFYDIISREEEQKIKEAIDSVFNNMRLLSDEDVFIVSPINFDCIIYSSTLSGDAAQSCTIGNCLQEGYWLHEF